MSAIRGIFGIAAGADFASAFQQGLRARLLKSDPLALARVEIWTNTRRAARHIEETMAAQGAQLLPRIRVIGDLARQSGPPQDPVRRRFELMHLVEALLDQAPELAPRAAAYDLAAGLGDLIDAFAGAGVPLAKLDEIIAPQMASHWETARQFVALIAPYLDQEGAGPEAQLRAAVIREAARWQVAPPTHPVLVVGSTGSRPATALFMQAVAGLPQGALVLPGFDFLLDRTGWDALGPDTPEHPQAGFAALLARLGAAPDQVAPWAPPPARTQARAALISAALRPAPVTDGWRKAAADLARDLPASCTDIALMESKDAAEEARAIALCLREAAASGQHAALITPDATLSRRVSGVLARQGIVADESAGVPLMQSPPALFFSHITGLTEASVPVVALLGLLKHPLTASGGGRGRHMRRVEQAELGCLRGTGEMTSFAALASWARPQAPEWADWLDGIGAALAALPEGFGPRLAAHRALVEQIAAGWTGAGSAEALWDKGAGLALRQVLDGLAEAADAAPEGISPAQYRAVLGREIGAVRVRAEGFVPDPRISIWGTLEARVQSADLVVLGGLNEGVWPALPPPDPWLGRSLRAGLGLPSPDRTIGLAAHDFQTAFAAKRLVLSRALRQGGTVSVAARWLTRLENLLAGLGAPGQEALGTMRAEGARWRDLARALDTPPVRLPPAPRPSPAPPAKARPKRLAITDIERLGRDPYALYARKILGLRPLDPLGGRPDARARGTALHAVMEHYLDAGAPLDAEALRDAARAVLAGEPRWPADARIWLGRLAGLAERFVQTERARQARARPGRAETRGLWPVAGIELVGKADRIDFDADGRAWLYDYKSSLPSAKETPLFHPQLQIEALMLAAGAFEGLGRLDSAGAELISLGGDAGEARALALEPEALDAVRARLLQRLAMLADPGTGFTARTVPQDSKWVGDYDHLARYGEWEDGAQSEIVRIEGEDA